MTGSPARSSDGVIRISGLSQSPLAGHAPSSFLFLVPDKLSSAVPFDGAGRRACPDIAFAAAWML